MLFGVVHSKYEIHKLNTIRIQNHNQTFFHFVRYHFIQSLFQMAIKMTKQIQIASLIIDRFVCDITLFQYTNIVTMTW